MEFLDIDDALVMSPMEESPCDQERYEDNVNKQCRSKDVTRMWDMGQMDGQDYWNPCDFEMGWAEMDVMPSSPSDHGCWCINPYEDEMEGITEIFDVSSNLNNHQFWQESYNSVICD
ncbi:putative Heat stress transcription factor B-4b [Senna tora]|uniref:Putative Heat stress transcription factor B-4b n=1 Tax=Senna tora TaxID=362788 RepID=A0A834WCT5_9FABA|nr:putative Heat stress transcription factor B-4b [Senna tora]